MPLDNFLPMYNFIHEENDDILEPMEERIIQQVELDEMRSEDLKKNIKLQLENKYLFDKKTTHGKFREGDLVMMRNAKNQEKGKHGKFEAIWLGPFEVTDKHGEDSYFLQNIEGEVLELLVHGQFLKKIFV